MRLRDLAGIDSDSEVTGFAIDHRKVAPGSVFGAFQGAAFNGEDFIGEAVDARRGRGGRPARSRGRARCRTSPTPSRGACSPQLAAQILRALSRGRGRGDRHQRQDLDGRNDPPDVAHDRATARPRSGRLGVTTSDDQVKTGLTTPDIVTFLSNMAGPEAHGHQPCRLRGVEPRPRPASRRRRAAGRRGLHQFQPRPPRLPPVDGRLFRGQDAAVRRAAAARGDRRWSGPTIPSRTR